MRFLVVTQYFPPEIGAAQVRLAGFVRQLVRLGHDVEVVTALPNYPDGEIRPEFRGCFYRHGSWEGVPVHRVWIRTARGTGAGRLASFLSFAVTALLGLARAKRPDFIVVNSAPLFAGLPARVASFWWRVPVIFTVADLWPDAVRDLGIMREGLGLRLAERLERSTYRQARFVTAVTQGIYDTLLHVKGVPKEKLLFLPNGVDTEVFHPRTPDLDLAKELDLVGRVVILYAGTLGIAHRLEVAIDAMESLQADSPEIVLILIGSGNEKQRLIRYSCERGAKNVRFLDAMPPEYVARLCSLARAGLSTLKDAPMMQAARPAKVLPMMAGGLPIIYSGAGEGARLVEDAEAGIVTPPEDAEALANAIRRLVGDPDLAARLGNNGRRFAEEQMSWQILVEDWLRDLRDRTADSRDGRLSVETAPH